MLYVAFVALARAMTPAASALKQLLGFSKLVVDTPLPSNLIVDIATVSEGTAEPPPRAPAFALATADDGS